MQAALQKDCEKNQHALQAPVFTTLGGGEGYVLRLRVQHGVKHS